jgi:uncharacterized protein (TIGR02594 family)
MTRLVAVLAATLILIAPADARTRHRHARHHHPVSHSILGGDLVSRARSYLGKTASELGLPGRLWCADFMNMLLAGGTGSRQAKSYLHYGTRIYAPQVGAIAILSRGRGGHVGVVSGITDNGDPIVISGNHGREVGEGRYPKSRVLGYVMP